MAEGLGSQHVLNGVCTSLLCSFLGIINPSQGGQVCFKLSPHTVLCAHAYTQHLVSSPSPRIAAPVLQMRVKWLSKAIQIK